MHFDLAQIIETVGYFGLFAIVFSESGFFGFFLPGDSLLFTAGFLASQGILNFVVVLFACFSAAVIGDSVGYWIGNKLGTKFLFKDNSKIFKKKYLEQTKAFYEKHGGKAIILARFVPVVRTFVPLVAGVAEMEYRRFFFFNVVGGMIWAIGLVTLGFTLGKSVPGIEKFIEPVIIVIILVSLVPMAYHVLKENENRLAIKKKISVFLNKLPIFGKDQKK